MSLTKSATRLSLLAGSSLTLAGLSAAAALGLALTPGLALAANECGDPSANGAAADVFVCPLGTYPTGMSYTSDGDLSVDVAPRSDLGTGGAMMTAGASPTNADDLTMRIAGEMFGGYQQSLFPSTAFPKLIDLQSQMGDIVVDLAYFWNDFNDFSSTPIDASNDVTTHGIYAVSHGGGDVTLQRTGSSRSSADLRVTGAASVAAVEARSIGGGDVTIRGSSTADWFVTGGDHGIWASTDGGGSIDIDVFDLAPSSGRLYGIRAQAAGAGSVTIDGAFQGGSYGVHATAGTGLLTISGQGYGLDADGVGVYMSSTGDAMFTGQAGGGLYGIHMPNLAAGTTTTINLTGDATGGTSGIRAAGAGGLDVNVVGNITLLNFDFAGMSAPVVVGISGNGRWSPPAGASTVADGNFSIEIAADGRLIGSTEDNNGLETPRVVTFAGPTSSLTNAGFIIVAPARDPFVLGSHEGELHLIGLEEFHHSGTILMGGLPGERRTDGSFDDIFVFEDGTWIGESGRIVFDLDTNRAQADCNRDPTTFDFSAADCVRIIDSTVEGVTYVAIEQAIPGDRGRLTQEMVDDGILLIDAPGSTVTAENFVLDPQSRGYSAASRSIDKGLFQYVLLFDPDASQFKLFPTLSGAAYQLPMAATTAQSLWRLSTGSWLERQADLRGGVEQGVSGGVWLRASGEQADREVVSAATLGGLPFSVDNSQQARTYAITGGVDLLSASADGMGYVVGLMAGYAHADVEYETSSNTQAMDGWVGGAYAGFIAGGLFVDAAVNVNNVILDTDDPGFDFFPTGTILSSRLLSVGGQVEAGWRLPFGEGLFAEPLASVSYVRSKMEDLEIVPDDASRPGLEVSYDDPVSFRAGIGGRVGMDQDFGVVRTQVSVLGRIWNEFEGENTASIHNLAFPTDPDIPVTDDFSGQFNELAVGASIYSPGGVVSGFVNLGGKFGDDYEAKTGSMGVRVAW